MQCLSFIRIPLWVDFFWPSMYRLECPEAVLRWSSVCRIFIRDWHLWKEEKKVRWSRWEVSLWYRARKASANPTGAPDSQSPKNCPMAEKLWFLNPPWSDLGCGPLGEGRPLLRQILKQLTLEDVCPQHWKWREKSLPEKGRSHGTSWTLPHYSIPFAYCSAGRLLFPLPLPFLCMCTLSLSNK